MKCKYCHMADLTWKQVEEKWRLHTPVGYIHQCPRKLSTPLNPFPNKAHPDTSAIPWNKTATQKPTPKPSSSPSRQPANYIPDFSGTDIPVRCSKCNIWIVKPNSLQSGLRQILDAYSLLQHSCHPKRVKRNYFAFPSSPLKK